MISLTFGEQVKIVLSRKDMTIKELAEEIEARTGKKMSRQNLTERRTWIRSTERCTFLRNNRVQYSVWQSGWIRSRDEGSRRNRTGNRIYRRKT